MPARTIERPLFEKKKIYFNLVWVTRDMRKAKVANVSLPWFRDLVFTATDKVAQRLSFKRSRRKAKRLSPSDQ